MKKYIIAIDLGAVSKIAVVRAELEASVLVYKRDLGYQKAGYGIYDQDGKRGLRDTLRNGEKLNPKQETGLRA